MNIDLDDIASVSITTSPSGPLYTITGIDGGQDRQVDWEWIRTHYTEAAQLHIAEATTR